MLRLPQALGLFTMLVCCTALIVEEPDRPCTYGYELDCDRRSPQAVCPDSEARAMFYQAYDYGLVNKLGPLNPWCEAHSEDDPDAGIMCSEGARYCEGKGLLFDIRKTGRDSLQRDGVKPGVLTSNCRIVRDREKPTGMKGFSWAPMLRDVQASEVAAGEEEECLLPDKVIEKAIIVARDFPGNLFHVLADVILAYMTLHGKGWVDDDSVRLFFLDGWRVRDKDGPSSIWNFLLPSQPTIAFGTMGDEHGQVLRINDAAFTVQNRAGFHYGKRPLPTCNNSGLVMDFAARMMKNAGTLDIATATVANRGRPKGQRRATVSLICRGKGGGAWGTRQVLNEPELIEWLSHLQVGDVAVDLQIARMENKTMVEQLELIAKTDVLVGMHGAGLTHVVFLPQGSALVELFNMHDEDEEYVKLATLAGHHYFNFTGTDEAKHHVRKDLIHDDGRVNHRLADEEIDFMAVDYVKQAVAKVFDVPYP